MTRPVFDLLVDLLGLLPGSTDPAALAAELGAVQDWVPVIAEADRQVVLVALSPLLRQAGIEDRLPDEVAEALALFHRANTARNERMAQALEEIATACNACGIRPTLLKGANRLLDDLYPDRGMRLMADLDVLVPEERSGAVVERLQTLGYDIEPESYEWEAARRHHLPPLRRRADGVRVELHIDAVHRPFHVMLPVDELVEAATPAALGGATVLIPAARHQFLHLVIHDQFGNHGFRRGTLRLRTLLEGRRMLERLAPGELDWVLRRLARHGQGRVGRHFRAMLDLWPGPAGPAEAPAAGAWQRLETRGRLALCLAAARGHSGARRLLITSDALGRVAAYGWGKALASCASPAFWRSRGREVGAVFAAWARPRD